MFNVAFMLMSHCQYLWVGLNLEVIVTEVALHAELEDGCGVVFAYSGLLCVVPDTHADMRPTAIAPDVVWQLKPDTHNDPSINTIDIFLTRALSRRLLLARTTQHQEKCTTISLLRLMNITG